MNKLFSYFTVSFKVNLENGIRRLSNGIHTFTEDLRLPRISYIEIVLYGVYSPRELVALSTDFSAGAWISYSGAPNW